MKIHNSTKSFNGKNPVVTMGVFDGVHSGHIALLQKTVELAQNNETESVVLTFYPHPRIVLNQEPEKLKLLTSLDEKLKIINQSGVNHVIILPFTLELAAFSAEKFIEEILVNDLQTGCLIVGYNHRFGKGGITFEKLQNLSEKFNFGLCQINRVETDNYSPSSTKIRNLLLEGEIEQANKMLGYRYIIEGKVKEGNRIGRKLSFPTANIFIEEPLKLIPPNGVYACFVQIAGEFFEGMVNIGVCPTINKQNADRSIEVHIFDFERDIYGKNVEINMVTGVRDEIKFSSLAELRQQIEKDEIIVRNILKKHNKHGL